MSLRRVRSALFLVSLGSTAAFIGVRGASQAYAAAEAAETDGGSADPAISLNAALTQPSGSWTYSGSLNTDASLGYSPLGVAGIFLNSFIYGFSDAVQGSLTVQPLLTDNSYVSGTAALKAGVRTGAISSLSGEVGFSLLRFHSGSSANDDRPWIKVPRASLFATACLGADCGSHFSAHVRYLLAFSDPGTTQQSLLYGVNLLQRVGAHVKLRLDVEGASDEIGGDLQKRPGFALTYGLRFFVTDLAADVGLMKPIGGGKDDRIHLGLPSVALAYRWR